MTDRLMRWIAARRTGSWEAFKEAHDWVHSTSQSADGRAPRPTETAQELQLLGAVDFDWLARTWTAREPAIGGLSGANFAGIVIGVLGGHQRERLAELEAGEAGAVLVERALTTGGLERIIVVGDHDRDLFDAARHLDASWIPDIGEALAECLPTLDVLADHGAAEFGIPRQMRVERFTFDPDEPWQRVRTPSHHGFYRVTPDFGPRRFFTVLKSGVMVREDRQAAIYVAARGLGRPAVAYSEQEKRLYVPEWAMPPAPQAQALVLCSGLLPPRLYDRPFSGPNLYFPNVPRTVAEGVAESLEQPLRELSALQA
jgi:hypothetical protein